MEHSWGKKLEFGACGKWPGPENHSDSRARIRTALKSFSAPSCQVMPLLWDVTCHQYPSLQRGPCSQHLVTLQSCPQLMIHFEPAFELLFI